MWGRSLGQMLPISDSDFDFGLASVSVPMSMWPQGPVPNIQIHPIAIVADPRPEQILPRFWSRIWTLGRDLDLSRPPRPRSLS